MKTALVTGANRGIGYEICRQLGELGFHVIASGRNETKINDAASTLSASGYKVTPQVLDVTNEDSIATVSSFLAKKGITLDALVNNAAILLDGNHGLLENDKETITRTLEANTIAPLLVTKGLMSNLSGNARIVMMSSGAGTFCAGVSAWAPIYSMSKTALNALTLQLHGILSPKGMVVNAVCPGWVKTDMGGAGAAREVSLGAETPVWLATEVEESGKFWRDKKEISW